MKGLDKKIAVASSNFLNGTHETLDQSIHQHRTLHRNIYIVSDQFMVYKLIAINTLCTLNHEI